MNEKSKMYIKFSIIIHIIAVHTLLQSAELINLEDMAQDFVLEAKQITIPGFAGAFNPCITKWRDSLLMCFRVRDEKMVSTFEIGFVWLDKNFNLVGTPSVLKIYNDPSTFTQTQDPRLITIKERLYIVYNNFVKLGEVAVRRMFISEVHYENEQFFITNPLCLHSFEGSSNRWEKNWVPFNYNDNLLLSYSIFPHRVLQPLESGECTTISSTRGSIDWKWGELRGGTPALPCNGEYLAFFHSSKDMPTVHSQGKKISHYFLGAYTFSKKPPFEVTKISPEPIVGKHFYSGPAYNTWKPLRVVFPTGYIADEKYVWVSCGKQDFEIWIIKLDRKGLYKSLIPCSTLTNEGHTSKPHVAHAAEIKITNPAIKDSYEDS